MPVSKDRSLSPLGVKRVVSAQPGVGCVRRATHPLAEDRSRWASLPGCQLLTRRHLASRGFVGAGLGTRSFYLFCCYLLFLVSPLSAQQIYDLLLKNGHVIDPKNQRNGRYDIAVVGNKIVRVGENLPSSNAKLVVDLSHYYVTPGLIDIHTHFDEQGAELNLNPDHNALQSGVTTAVDAGSSGWKNFEQFQKQVINRLANPVAGIPQHRGRRHVR